MCLDSLFFNTTDDSRISNELSRNSSLSSLTQKRKYTKSKVHSYVDARKIKAKSNTRQTTGHINRSMLKNCCSDLCSSNVTFNEVKELREWFHTDGKKARTEVDKNSLLREIIDSQTEKRGLFGTKDVYEIKGSVVKCCCASGMKKILGLSSKKWNKVKNGDAVEDLMEGANTRRSVISNKEELIYGFLKSLRDEFSENIPNNTVFDLPSNFTIHEIMRMFHTRFTQTTVSTAYLCKIWAV